MLFRIEKNPKEHPDEIREFIPVTAAFAFKTLKPFLELSENSFMRSLFSDELYDQIESIYLESINLVSGSGSTVSGSSSASNRIISGSGSSSSSISGSVPEPIPANAEAIKAKVLRFMQTAEINYAFFKGLAKLTLYISGDGIQRVTSSNDGKQTPYHYQTTALESSFKEDAFTAIDMAFKLLEKYKVLFPAFTNSSYYTIVSNCIVSNATEFSKIYSIGESRVVFLNLIPHMSKAQDIDLTEKLGVEFLEYIKSKLNSTDKKIIEVVRLTKIAVVHLTIARAIESLGVNFTDKGLFFETLEATGNSNIKQNLLSASEKNTLGNSAKRDADSYIESVINYIELNTDLAINYNNNNTSRTIGGTSTVWAT